MTDIVVHPATGPLAGSVPVPSDKSIGHRAVLFAALCKGRSRIQGFSRGEDNVSTMRALERMGATVTDVSKTEILVDGVGLFGLRAPDGPIDCGNSGTTIRLLLGLLAGQKFASFLTGTAQIRRRPMGRVARPLRGMGADIMGRQNGEYAPLGIRPARLRGVEYDMPVASAQVKSCVLLAGLYSQGLTVVREPGPARDHTERMLAAMGAPVHVYGRKVTSERPDKPLSPLDITVPGDLSSAAFLLAAGAIVPGSHITIRDVGVNPTRCLVTDRSSLHDFARGHSVDRQCGGPVCRPAQEARSVPGGNPLQDV